MATSSPDPNYLHSCTSRIAFRHFRDLASPSPVSGAAAFASQRWRGDRRQAGARGRGAVAWPMLGRAREATCARACLAVEVARLSS